MDEQQAPPATGSPFSSTSSWHSAFDPPSETLSPKHDKKRPKDVASKKSKKKNKKSEKTSTTLRQSQVQAQPSAGNSAVHMESPVPAQQDFEDPVFEGNPSDETHPTGYKGRGVASMMVRSGLRCPCHYVRRHLCPVKLLADEFGFTSSTSASL